MKVLDPELPRGKETNHNNKGVSHGICEARSVLSYISIMSSKCILLSITSSDTIVV